MSNNFLKFLHFFDFFGNQFTPSVNYYTRQTSVFGGVLGIMYIGIIATLTYYFSYDIFYHDSPSLVNKVIIDNENSLNVTMGFGWYTLVIAKGQYGLSADQVNKDKTFLNTNIDRLIQYIPTYHTDTEASYVALKKCNESDFYQSYEKRDPFFFDNFLGTMTCIDKSARNLTLYKRSRYPGAKYVDINVYICENATYFNDCLSTNDIDYYFKYYEFRPVYMYNAIQMNISNYLDPMSQYIEFFFSKTIYPETIPVTHYLEIQNKVLSTNMGYFSQEYKDVILNTVSTNRYLVGGPYLDNGKVDGVYRRKINNVVFYIDKSTQQTLRNYPYVQDIVANVVGFLGLILSLLQLFIQRLYDSMTLELIIHQLFDVDESVIDEHNLSSVDNIESINKKVLTLEKNNGNSANNINSMGIGMSINLVNSNTNNIPPAIPLQNINCNEFNENDLKDNNNNFNDNKDNDNDNNTDILSVNKLNRDKQMHQSLSKQKLRNEKLESISKLSSFENNNNNFNLNLNINKSIVKFGKKESSAKLLKKVDENSNEKSNLKNKSNNSFNLKNIDIKSLSEKQFFNKMYPDLDEDEFETESIQEDKYFNKENKALMSKQASISNIYKIDPAKVDSILNGEKIQRINYSIVDPEKPLLSICDHFLISYLCCLVTRRANKIKNYYDKLYNMTKKYTDIINISNNIYEVEKLKYLLLDNTQMKIFNLRNKINCRRDMANDKFTSYFYTIHDLEEGFDVNNTKELVKTIYEDETTDETTQQINNKLLDFLS